MIVARLKQGPTLGIFLVIVALLATVVAACWLQEERVSFVAKCWKNGNGLVACNCTFNALGDLPANYRDLATTWAHEGGMAFAGGVMRLIGAETLRIGSAHIGQLTDFKDREGREKAIRVWMQRVAKHIGWKALRNVAPTVAPAIASADVALPIVVDAVEEAAKAQRIMGRHCGTEKSFIVRVSETRAAAMQMVDALSTRAIETAVDAGSAAVESGGNAMSRSWKWMKSWIWTEE
jgi:hypothetical protein